MKFPSVKSLWLSFVVVTATLLGLLFYRVAGVISTDDATMPRFLPLYVDRAAPPVSTALPGKNPFDPSGVPWASTQAGGSQAGTGRLKGIVVFPGTQFVLTETGVVTLGTDLKEGKLLAVRGEGVLVETAGKQEHIPVAASKRMRLNDLNKVQARTVLKEQGRP